MNGTGSLDDVTEGGPDDPLGSLGDGLGGLDEPLRPQCRCTEPRMVEVSR